MSAERGAVSCGRAPLFSFISLSRSHALPRAALLLSLSPPPLRCVTAVAEIRTLFLNLQYLLNMLRPYQAREELIGLVEGQIEEKRRLIKELGGACDACKSVAEEKEGEEGVAAAAAAAASTEGAAQASSSSSTLSESAAQKQARETLEKLVG